MAKTATAEKAAETKNRGLVVYQSRGQEVQLSPEIVRNFLVTGKKELVSDQELVYFLSICKARQLNPFVKDCYLIKYNTDPAAIITSIDFYRSRARASSDCKGWSKGVICLKENGELRYSNGLVLPNEKLVGGWFRARPVGWEVDFELEVNLAGFIKTKADGSTTAFWAPEKQASQIMKVVESQGLRTVWPDLFQGLYGDAELGLSTDVIDITAASTITGAEPGGQKGTEAGKQSEAEATAQALAATAFGKLVFEKNLSPERLAILTSWLEETAAGQKVPTSVAAFKAKVMESGKFDACFAAFEAKHPTQEPEQEKGPESAGEGQAPEAGPDGGAPPEGKTFEQERDEVWGGVVTTMVPLVELQEVGVSSAAELTPENIEKVKALVEKHTKKAKK
jgi:phage recombination protein Bet